MAIQIIGWLFLNYLIAYFFLKADGKMLKFVFYCTKNYLNNLKVSSSFVSIIIPNQKTKTIF